MAKRFIICVFLLSAAFFLPDSAVGQSPQIIGLQNSEQSPSVSYNLRRGDKISVKFLYHPELNEPTLTIGPDGIINLQLIDGVQAEGVTIDELKKRLLKKYDEILINPVITVALLEFVAPRVFIGGQVAKPGSYELRQGDSLVEVIFLAGGFTGDANRRDVLYARRDESGEWEIRQINVLNILSRKKKEEDLKLLDGDHIFVPDSKLSRFNKAVETFRGLLPRIF